MVAGVGGSEQTIRPHSRQWCFRFVNEKIDLYDVKYPFCQPPVTYP